MARILNQAEAMLIGEEIDENEELIILEEDEDGPLMTCTCFKGTFRELNPIL